MNEAQECNTPELLQIHAELISMVLNAAKDPQKLIAIRRAAMGGADLPRMIRIERVAEILGCSRKTAERYVKQGKLRPIYRSPRKIFYNLDEVEYFATTGRVLETTTDLCD